MITINLKDAPGNARVLEGNADQALMEPLRDAGLIDATCGGAASCGTCHIFVGEKWLTATGERTEDEGYMLEALEEVIEVKTCSRLACQISLADALDGIELEIAPQV